MTKGLVRKGQKGQKLAKVRWFEKPNALVTPLLIFRHDHCLVLLIACLRYTKWRRTAVRNGLISLLSVKISLASGGKYQGVSK